MGAKLIVHIAPHFSPSRPSLDPFTNQPTTTSRTNIPEHQHMVGFVV